MRMVAVLANKEHPELGAISIPIPIRAGEYSSVMKMLSALGIGDVTARDCQIEELTAPPPERKNGSQARRCPSLVRMGSALPSAPAGRAVSPQSSATAGIPLPARPGATLELTLLFPPARRSVRLSPAWSPPPPTTPAATATM